LTEELTAVDSLFNDRLKN